MTRAGRQIEPLKESRLMDRRTLVLSTLALVGGAGSALARPYGETPAAAAGASSTPVSGATPLPPAAPAPVGGGPAAAPAEAYESDEIVRNVSDFLGVTAESAGGVVERLFKERGRPTAYIAGEEGSAAITIGARY